jgi:hypothetical protein
MLEEPPALADCLTRLSLAQAAAGDDEGFGDRGATGAVNDGDPIYDFSRRRLCRHGFNDRNSTSRHQHDSGTATHERSQPAGIDHDESPV